MSRTSRNKMSTPSNFEMVVGIDFGTTHSGYAYSYYYDQGNIHVNKNWKAGHYKFKVPTSILFDNNQDFVTFGFDAEDRYTELAETNEENTFYFFQQFKMILYNEKGVHRDMYLRSENGKVMKAIHVFSAAIKYLMTHFLQLLNERNPCNHIEKEHVQWVLTVPAIWSDAAKQFMREAAQQAGIAEDHLKIALEPECASLFTKKNPPAWDLNLNKENTKYLVLDCGGGTIDSTVHEVLSSGFVKELYKVSGSDWGSIKIDQLYIQLMEKIFSKEVLQKFKTQSPAEYVLLLRHFDVIKRRLNQNKVDDFNIKISEDLLDVYKEMYGIDFFQVNSGRELLNGVKLHGKRRLRVPVDVIMKMEEEVCRNTQKHVEQLVSTEVHGITAIVLVGGFSNSNILKESIVKVCPSNIRVERPEDPELSVMKGAVLFGWNSGLIRSRRSKNTYGIHRTEDFDPEKHPNRLKVMADGRTKCDQIFDTLIKVNDEVPLGMTVQHRYRALYSNATQTRLRLFSSKKENVTYCDEKDVKLVGELSLPMPDTTGGTNRKLVVEINFGETELRLHGFDETSGSRVSTKFDFFSKTIQ